MEAIATSLRRRILADCDAGMSMSKAAENFSASLACVEKRKQQRRDTASIEPKPHNGGNPRALAGREKEIHRLMRDAVTRTIEEFHAELKATCSRNPVWEEVRRLGYTSTMVTMTLAQVTARTRRT